MKIQVNLWGCDDSTHVELEVTHEELAFLRRLEELTRNASTCRCMPTLTVRKGGSISPDQRDGEI